MKKFIINENDAKQTIFNFLKKNFKKTQLSVIYKWFRTKNIKINGRSVNDRKIKLNVNDNVFVYTEDEIVSSDINVDYFNANLKIVYEDENILIVNKPFDVEVHSFNNNDLDKMVNAYLKSKKFVNDSYSFKISHAHRLDKPTSGLIIYPLNKISSIEIYDAINIKKIEKYYIAKIENQNHEIGLIRGYSFKDEKNNKTIFSKKQQNHFTEKKCSEYVEWFNKNKNQLLIKLETGRKHQIRAIASFFKCPIINDYKYGANKIFDQNKIGLVAFKIIFKFDNKSSLYYLNNKNIHIDIPKFMDN